SGQFLFNFDAARVVRGARKVAALPARRQGKGRRTDAETATAGEWCDLAVELEHESAIERDATSVTAHINLGCLLHASGNHAAAERHYRKALKYGGDHALAWYNIG